MRLPVIIGLLCIVSSAAHAELRVLDDRDSEIMLTSPARRIVSLAPMTTELLFAAGAGEYVVGVSAFSDYPPPAQHIPQIGNSAAIDLERIVALRPDLVVAWGSGNNRADFARIERLGFPLFVLEPRRLPQIGSALARLARLAGTEDIGNEAATQFGRELDALRAEYLSRPSVTVFMQISDRPMMTLSDAHITGDLVALCGGKNIFGDRSGLAPRISIEEVLRSDPQAILVSDALGEVAAAYWRAKTGILAARHGQIHFVSATLTTRQTPRILEGARQICRLLDIVRSP